jgi:hypothetical protein
MIRGAAEARGGMGSTKINEDTRSVRMRCNKMRDGVLVEIRTPLSFVH